MGCNLPRKVAESSPDSWIPNFHPLFPKKNFIFLLTIVPNRSIDIRENVFLHGEKKFPYKFVYEKFEKFRFRKNEWNLFLFHYHLILRLIFSTIAQNTAEPHYLAIISTYSLLIPVSFLRLPMLMQEQKAAEHHPRNGL